MKMQKEIIDRIILTVTARVGDFIAFAIMEFSMPQLLFACRLAAIDVLAGPLAPSRLNR